VTVRFTPAAKGGAGIYTIVRHLPAQGDGDRQYRIKSDTESHERVVAESQLTVL
jgi:hypothetical protein